MQRYYFGKIIRDHILASMLKEGCKVQYQKLGSSQRRNKLADKLVEEADELKNADENEFLEELGDVQLVVDALVEGLSITKQRQFKEQVARKSAKKGGFTQGIWVESVAVPKNSKWIQYFDTQPQKYPKLPPK